MIKKIAIVAIIVVLAAVAFVGYAFFRPPEEASAPIEAVPLNVEETTETDAAPAEEAAADASAAAPVADSDTQVEDAPETTTDTETDAEVEVEAEAADPTPATETGSEVAETAETESEAAEDQAEAMADSEATEAEGDANGAAEANGTTDTETEAPVEEAAAGPTVFEIIPGQSEARFLIDEVLRGDPITVVGTTDQVAGQLALDPADLSSAQVGVIQVNARTLATDNNFRNRAIKNRILLTDEHEFVTFTPTEITGLPESAAVGEALTFQVTGDLTVTDVTRPVTFDITATPVSEERIEGTASTAFLYTDFDLFIPAARVVDSVDDEVRLEIDFVAEAVSDVAG